MSNNDWFADAVGGGAGAPGANLKDAGATVLGEIVDQLKVEYRDYDTKQPVILDDGTKEQQFVIILQTDVRNFADGVQGKEADGTPTPPDQDDGRRAIYVRKQTNIHGGIGRALQEAGVDPAQGLATGGKLWIKFVGKETNPKNGRSFKQHEVRYQPPAATAGVFEGAAGTTDSAPTSTTAQAAPAASQPAQQASAPVETDEPPF